MPVRVLLTGASGQVGGDLLPMLEPFASVIAPGRSELDLGNPGEIQRFVSETRPHWIINPAAYTAVDKAESEPELAYAINADAPRALGEAAAQLRIPVIHFSTDYVYSGAGSTPWVEDDAPGPLGVYGSSKLAGDQALAASGAAYIILRTSWVYGTAGKNFLRTILRLAQEKDELRIVDDQHGSPTWSRDLARTVVHIIRSVSADSVARTKPIHEIVREVRGVYHVAGAGDTTWFGFAREFLRTAAEVRPQSRLAHLAPIATRDYPTPAQRPLNSRLNCSRIRDVFGVAMPEWEESAATVTREVLSH